MRFRPFSHRAVALVAVVFGIGALAACQPVKTPVAPADCTQYWRGYVLPTDHNYAGLGAYNGSDRYMCKPTPWQGVRAQVQHLRNYADAGATHSNLGSVFEPRPKYDEAAFDNFPLQGSAPSWIDLNGKWAVPGTTYGQTIVGIFNEMRVYNNLTPVPVDTTATITGYNDLTADQIAAYVIAVYTKNPTWVWKPEIGPVELAQVFLDQGSQVLVRGDLAFCQSILETTWFAWPNSPPPAPPPASAQSTDPVIAGYYELQHVRSRN